MNHFAFGWLLITLGFASGALLGLGFHKPGFLGGYDSLRRRMIRLGHIALVALGALNVLYALTEPRLALKPWEIQVASWGMMIGTVGMPLCCGLTAWRTNWRLSFPIPVAALITAGITITRGLWT